MIDKNLQKFIEDVEKIFVDYSNEIKEQDGELDTKAKLLLNLELVKQVIFRVIPLVKGILYQPIKFMLNTGKKEMKIFSFIGFVFFFMFIIFFVGWFFLSVFVASYIYDKGNSISFSVMYSLMFQFITFIVIAIVGYLAFRKSIFKKLIDTFKKAKKNL